ncbi:MAG: hypothetical protein CEE38_01640 [Planctomycetes bacterium B3_Pla]|nr:MAG: hypothetical protein CEE38_01640 [Planctomycetes bacterium B3_Pla]
MTDGQAELIRYRLSRAKETFEEANELVNSGHLYGAANRIYYACFYAVVALILTKDLSSSKQSGVIGLFNKNFVRTGDIPKEMGKFYSWMFDNRLESDYGELIEIDPDGIKQDLAAAAEFIDLITAMISNK